MDSSGETRSEAEMRLPRSNEWLSADAATSNAFWMTTESPKVTSKVVSGETSRLFWMISRCTP